MILGLCLVLFIFISILSSKAKTYQRNASAERKGLEGERKVNEILSKGKYIYFHDTLLKQGKATSQFDHIVVLPNKTVIVIETKNKDGVISGSALDNQWKQVIGRNHYSFYNPIMQNEGHIRMLYKKMNEYKLYGYRVVSLVVFTSERCSLQNAPQGVIHIRELPYALKQFKKKTLFNRSRPLISMLRREDLSKNKKEVYKHKEFAMNAKYYKR